MQDNDKGFLPPRLPEDEEMFKETTLENDIKPIVKIEGTDKEYDSFDDAISAMYIKVNENPEQ